MTVESFTPAPTYTISGVGPYAIPHPYTDGSIRATVTDGATVVDLAPGNFTVAPVASDVSGNLTLSAETVAAYMGAELRITRETALEQGWQATQGARERSLESQLDRLTMIAQERAQVSGAFEVTLGRTLRATTALQPFTPENGKVVIFEGGQPVMGPTASDIATAQANSAAATAAASAASLAAAQAEAAKVAAQAAQAGVMVFKGEWTTGLLYSVGNVVLGPVPNQNQYHVKVPHIAGVFADDLAAGKLELSMPRGAAGEGTGNMNNEDNLQYLTNKPLAVANLGIADRLPQPGTVELFLGTAAPAGRLKLNGATISRATYAALWAHAQASGYLAASEGAKTAAQFGPGNGTTTFSLPDWRGRFVRGADDGAGVDAGRAAGTLQDGQNLWHQHSGWTSWGGGHTHTYFKSLGNYPAANGSVQTRTGNVSDATGYAGDHNHSFTTDGSGGGETRPANTNALWVIVF